MLPMKLVIVVTVVLVGVSPELAEVLGSLRPVVIVAGILALVVFERTPSNQPQTTNRTKGRQTK
jgi:hypothetical protein